MNKRIIFTDQYLVGIKQVDREHRKLFAIVGSIQDGLESGGDGALAAARIAVGELLEYTRTHFASEEALMAQYAFPEFESHRQLHQELLGQVHDMEMRVELEGEVAAIELSRFLGQWLALHIQVADKRFGAFVAETDDPAAT
jgi:hemerythrin